MSTSLVQNDRRQIGRSERRWSSYYPAISVRAYLAIALVTHGLLSECNTPSTSACLVRSGNFHFDTTARFVIFQNQYAWIVTYLFLVLTAIVTFGVACRSIVDIVRRAPETKAFIVTLAAALVSAAIMIPFFVSSGWTFALGTSILEFTTYKILPRALTAVRAVNFLSAFAVAAVIVAACTLLRGAEALDPPDSTDTFAVRARRLLGFVRRLRVLLLTGAVMTVIGTFETTSLLSWGTTMVLTDSAFNESQRSAQSAPGTPLPDSVAKPRVNAKPAAPYLSTVDAISNTAGFICGSFYSLLLAAIFIPAFTVVRERARALGETATADTSTETSLNAFLTQHDLSATFPRQLGTVLAVLGPALLGGPLQALVKAFVS